MFVTPPPIPKETLKRLALHYDSVLTGLEQIALEDGLRHFENPDPSTTEHNNTRAKEAWRAYFEVGREPDPLHEVLRYYVLLEKWSHLLRIDLASSTEPFTIPGSNIRVLPSEAMHGLLFAPYNPTRDCGTEPIPDFADFTEDEAILRAGYGYDAVFRRYETDSPVPDIFFVDGQRYLQTLKERSYLPPAWVLELVIEQL